MPCLRFILYNIWNHCQIVIYVYLHFCYSCCICEFENIKDSFVTDHLFILILFFQRSTFVGFAQSFGISYPPQRPMTSDFEGFLILILEKEDRSLNSCDLLSRVKIKVLIKFDVVSIQKHQVEQNTKQWCQKERFVRLVLQSFVK